MDSTVKVVGEVPGIVIGFLMDALGPASLEKPISGLRQIRHGRLLLRRVKPTEIIESRLLAAPFL